MRRAHRESLWISLTVELPPWDEKSSTLESSRNRRPTSALESRSDSILPQSPRINQNARKLRARKCERNQNLPLNTHETQPSVPKRTIIQASSVLLYSGHGFLLNFTTHTNRSLPFFWGSVLPCRGRWFYQSCWGKEKGQRLESGGRWIAIRRLQEGDQVTVGGGRGNMTVVGDESWSTDCGDWLLRLSKQRHVGRTCLSSDPLNWPFESQQSIDTCPRLSWKITVWCKVQFVNRRKHQYLDNFRYR